MSKSKVSFKDQNTFISPDLPQDTPPLNTAVTEATVIQEGESDNSGVSHSDNSSEHSAGSGSAAESVSEIDPGSAIPHPRKEAKKDKDNYRKGLKRHLDTPLTTGKSPGENRDSEEEEEESNEGSGSDSDQSFSDQDQHSEGSESDSDTEEGSTDNDTDHSSTTSESESPEPSKEKKKSRSDKSRTGRSESSKDRKKRKDKDDRVSSGVEDPVTGEEESRQRRSSSKSSRKEDQSEEGVNEADPASRKIKVDHSTHSRSKSRSEGDTELDIDDQEERRKERHRRKAEKQKEEKKGSQSDKDDDEEASISPRPVRESSPRTWKHDMVRIISLYLVPVLLAIPTSLLLSLNIQLLTPLYNSIPLSLHTPYLYVGYTVFAAVIYWWLTLQHSAKDTISARVCFGLAALSGDVVAVYGRRIGSLSGGHLGPEWGALGARAILGAGVVSGATAFALLCFDHVSSIAPATTITNRPRNLGSILYRAGFYVFHIYTFEKMWSTFLSNNVSVLNQHPEKTILFVSLFLTALSLFLRSSSSTTPFPTRVNNLLTSSMGLSPEASNATSKLTNLLPRQAFPLLLLLRIPLLILALRQQIFLRPPLNVPYITANCELRVISSERSLTGQIVIAENLKDGYRFLRCDNSILGGRWIREVPDRDVKGGIRTDMGDSIFATFNLQEIAVLAHRSDPSESLIKTLQLTTDLEVNSDGDEQNDEKEPERALIIGLGVGIAASAYSRKGMYVDIVEIDPAVYMAAHNHFELYTRSLASTNILDGSTFVSKLAEMKRDKSNQSDTENENKNGDVPMWDYVIQDCFTGGSVPGEMFTKEFWTDLGDLVKDDGIIAMNFAGVLKSKASKAVLVTLTSVFPQCRAFGDGFEVNQGPNDLVNMVVFCTKTHSPLLTFRALTSFDGLRSPLRAHVYSTFHQNEIRLDSIINFDKDYLNPEFHLERGRAGKELNGWQKGSSLATWRAMQKILTPEMWLAY